MAKNKITLDILADITKKVHKGITTNSSSNISYDEKVLIVFTGSNVQLNERIQKIKELDKNISIVFSFMAEKILDTDYIINTLNPLNVYWEEDILDLEKITTDYSCIIGPNITMNTLSKLSMGIIDSIIPNLIWTFLYKGKKVYLDFLSVTNYLGSRSKNIGINKIIDNHINTVRSMGVVEITETNYRDKIISKNKSEFVKKNEQVNSSHNRVMNSHDNINKNYDNSVDDSNSKIITENDFLNKYANKKSVKFPKGTIVTPLARDKARDLRIELIIER